MQLYEICDTSQGCEFRGGQALIFGAYHTRTATKHTEHPHPRGGGARASRLTPGYQALQT